MKNAFSWLLKEIRSNLVWYILCLIGNSVYPTLQKLRHVPIDWWAFSLFALESFGFVITAVIAVRSTGSLAKGADPVAHHEENKVAIDQQSQVLKPGDYWNASSAAAFSVIHIELISVDEQRDMAQISAAGFLPNLKAGEHVKRDGASFWVPKSSMQSVEDSVYDLGFMGNDHFSGVQISVYHINANTKEVTIIAAFVTATVYRQS
jgi:hypothetical protein